MHAITFNLRVHVQVSLLSHHHHIQHLCWQFDPKTILTTRFEEFRRWSKSGLGVGPCWHLYQRLAHCETSSLYLDWHIWLTPGAWVQVQGRLWVHKVPDWPLSIEQRHILASHHFLCNPPLPPPPPLTIAMSLWSSCAKFCLHLDKIVVFQHSTIELFLLEPKQPGVVKKVAKAWTAILLCTAGARGNVNGQVCSS